MSDLGKQQSAKPGASYPMRDVAIDLPYLRGFVHGSRSTEHKLLKLFVEQSAIDLKALIEATTVDEWKQAAHVLKGSACGVGAWRVARAAENAEALNISPAHPRRDAELLQLQHLLDEVTSYIKVVLGSTESSS